MTLFIRTKEVKEKDEEKVTVEGQSKDPELLIDGVFEKARAENDVLVIKNHEDGGKSFIGNNTAYDIFPKDELSAQSIPNEE